MGVSVINYIQENIARILCIRKFEKKVKFKKQGYIVDFPEDFYTYEYGYSVYQKNIWNPIVYTKCGKTYTFEEIKKIYNI